MKEKRRKNIEEIVKDKQAAEDVELTFKPKISRASSRMASQSGNRNLTFLEREQFY